MVANAYDVHCIVALEDDFGIVAKCSAVRSSVNQCASLASFDSMFGCMRLIGSMFGFQIILWLACSNLATLHSKMSLKC